MNWKTKLFSSAFRVPLSSFIERDDDFTLHVAVSRRVEGDCEAVFVRADALRAEVLAVADGKGRLELERVRAPAAAFEQEAERARVGVRAKDAQVFAPCAGRGRLERKGNVRAFVVGDNDVGLALHFVEEFDALHVALALNAEL